MYLGDEPPPATWLKVVGYGLAVYFISKALFGR